VLLQLRRESGRLLACAVAVHVDPCFDAVFVPVDALEALLKQFGRREFARADELRGFGDCHWFWHDGYTLLGTRFVGGDAMSKVKVGILGGSGYTAVELIKILLRHPGAEIVAITSRQDEHITDLHPSLLGRLDLRCQLFDADALKAKGV